MKISAAAFQGNPSIPISKPQPIRAIRSNCPIFGASRKEKPANPFIKAIAGLAIFLSPLIGASIAKEATAGAKAIAQPIVEAQPVQKVDLPSESVADTPKEALSRAKNNYVAVMLKQLALEVEYIQALAANGSLFQRASSEERRELEQMANRLDEAQKKLANLHVTHQKVANLGKSRPNPSQIKALNDYIELHEALLSKPDSLVNLLLTRELTDRDKASPELLTLFDTYMRRLLVESFEEQARASLALGLAYRDTGLKDDNGWQLNIDLSL